MLGPHLTLLCFTLPYGKHPDSGRWGATPSGNTNGHGSGDRPSKHYDYWNAPKNGMWMLLFRGSWKIPKTNDAYVPGFIASWLRCRMIGEAISCPKKKNKCGWCTEWSSSRSTKDRDKLIGNHQLVHPNWLPKVMRALRGQNAGERERLRQEHLRLETLQVMYKLYCCIVLCSVVQNTKGIGKLIRKHWVSWQHPLGTLDAHAAAGAGPCRLPVRISSNLNDQYYCSCPLVVLYRS